MHISAAQICHHRGGEYINAFERLNNPGYNIPETPASEFLEFFLPRLNEGIVTEQIFSTLRDEGLLEAIGGWYKCGADRMSGVNRRKDESFDLIANLFNRATSAASQAAPYIEQTVQLNLTRNRSRQGKRLPSAYF